MFEKIISILINSHCELCNCTTAGENLCNDCINDLPLNNQCCIKCSNFIKAPQFANICGTCLNKPPIWSRAFVAFVYQDTIKLLIGRLKYSKQLHLSKTLVAISPIELTEKYDYIVPVPLHLKKLSKRKFNQSYLIAKALSKKLNIKLLSNATIRQKNTATQTALNQKERVKNMQLAFKVTKHEVFKNKKILVVDDVITTGSTLKSLVKEIKRYKPKLIDVWCVARSGSNQ